MKGIIWQIARFGGGYYHHNAKGNQHFLNSLVLRWTTVTSCLKLAMVGILRIAIPKV